MQILDFLSTNQMCIHTKMFRKRAVRLARVDFNVKFQRSMFIVRYIFHLKYFDRKLS